MQNIEFILPWYWLLSVRVTERCECGGYRNQFIWKVSWTPSATCVLSWLTKCMNMTLYARLCTIEIWLTWLYLRIVPLRPAIYFRRSFLKSHNVVFFKFTVPSSSNMFKISQFGYGVFVLVVYFFVLGVYKASSSKQLCPGE